MHNTALKRSSGRSAVPCMAVGTFFIGILLLQCFLPFTPARAQDYKPEKFDRSLLGDSLREQKILREEMEKIRLEMQRIMEEIKLAMKEEALKLKAELQGLQLETQAIQKEILKILEKSKNDFLEGKEEMRKELQKMRVEAKTMTKEINQVLQYQKEIWKQETAALKDSLVEAREEMDSAKANSEEVLQSSRSAFRVFQQEKVITIANSRAASDAAMLEAGNTFKKSQQYYKQDSKIISKELKAGMKETRETMQKRTISQRRDSKNSQRKVLAALNKAKNKKIAELKHDSTRKKLRRKKVFQPKRKRTQQPKPKVEDRKKETIKEVEREPKQEKIVKDEAELVVASLPDASAETAKESPQKKLFRFSKNISNLKNNLKNTSDNPGILLAKLGDAYLEAQRFMDSQKDHEERQNLLDLSDNGDLLLGSYEQAAWAYKLVLTFNRKNAETYLKIGKIYDEMKDGRNALMYAKLAHQIFKRNRNSNQMKETQSFIDLLTTKYENKSGKKMVRKG